MLNAFLNRLKSKDCKNSPIDCNKSGHDHNVSGKWRPGDIILDRYRIDEVFSGAMGTVYISEHLDWKVPMAIKTPKPEIFAEKEGLRMVLTEAESWVRLGMHPNIATCYYVLNIEEIPHLFIEYVDGGDLSLWLKTGRCRDLRTVLSLAVQFCHGMEYTHSQGIIHRDIKPGNILLTKNALLKITDFGIVQTFADDPGEFPDGEDGAGQNVGFRGTPSYASPEQFRDTGSIDLRSDIFSFGICLWLMLCGRRPYKNNTIPETAFPSPAHSSITFSPLLKELLLKSVAFDPNDRFQSFSELRHTINEAHTDIFGVPSPFMDLDCSIFQAENLNNRALSYLELDKREEGNRFLQKALDDNDTLPEAIFNLTLLKWKDGLPPETLYRQIESSRKRLPEAKILSTLAQSIRCDLHKDVWTITKDDEENESAPSLIKTYFPEYLLCKPRNSIDIFQESQLAIAAKANMQDLLAKGQYQKCSQILFKVWEETNYKKDSTYQRIYEALLASGIKKKLKGIVRLQTLRNCSVPSEKLFCFPNKRIFFSLCRDGLIYVHHLDDPNKLKVLSKFKNISTAALSPDGSHLSIISRDGEIQLIDLNSGKTKAAFSNQGQINAIAVNISNTRISAGFSDGRTKTYLLDKDKVYGSVPGRKNTITTLGCYNASNDFISGNEDGTIDFWSADQPEPLRIVKAHSKPVTTLYPAENGLYFISGASDGNIKIWDRQTGQCKKIFDSEERSLTASLVLPDCSHIVSAGRDDIITIWETESDNPAFLLDARGNGISSLTTGPTPHTFMAGCLDGSIILWMLVYELEYS